MRIRFFGYGAVATACVALSACGGGGDAAPPVENTASFPMTTVLANYVNQTRSSQASFSGTAIASGQSFAVSGSRNLSEATTSSTFDGVPALRKALTLTGTMSVAGTSIPLAQTTYAFFDSNYKPLGKTGTGSYCATTAYTPLPGTARIGDNGAWYTLNCYTSSSKQVKVSTSIVSYVLEPDSSTTAVLKVVYQATSTSGNSGTTTETFRITTGGSLTRMEESGVLSESGVTLNYVARYL
jgi:hypothetical protein